ncbi:MAG: hypothetical protein OXD44_02785 [Gammaproteobacteria bacterium]|nr:hypothetical protein [Gammaproteobacteria bacterium]
MVKKAFSRVRTSKLAKRSPERVAGCLAVCEQYLDRVRDTLGEAGSRDLSCSQRREAERVRHFLAHAERQAGQVRRRLLEGEPVPHGEKTFSIFEPHARWVAKGKAGRPVEIGVPVCVIEDQYRFILHHEVMWQGGDVEHAVPVVEAAQERHPELRMASFDRGFHSPGNQRKLAVRLDECALPVKGGLSREAAQRQSEDRFRSARKRHPGIESAISHLEHCGLGRVRTHGADGFARAVALSVLAASVKRLGRLVRDRERKRLERRQRLRAA